MPLGETIPTLDEARVPFERPIRIIPPIKRFGLHRVPMGGGCFCFLRSRLRPGAQGRICLRRRGAGAELGSGSRPGELAQGRGRPLVGGREA